MTSFKEDGAFLSCLAIFLLAAGCGDAPTTPDTDGDVVGALGVDQPTSGIVARGILIPLASASAASTAIVPVDPATLSCTDLITFDDVPGAPSPAVNVDGILTSGAGSFAERFSGQILSFGNSSSGGQIGQFDVLSRAPDEPAHFAGGRSGPKPGRSYLWREQRSDRGRPLGAS